jgi:hypothetical protein
MCICIRKEIENRKCWIILLFVDTHKRREKYLWNLNPLQISVKFLCRLPSWYNITSYFHFDDYHSFCVGFPFFKAIVSCRLNQRWEDICSFRAFPYKVQTSLQFFELVDDYIQSEINKPPMQTTCTVRFSYEVIFSFICWCTWHCHTLKRHTRFTQLLTCLLFFLSPGINVESYMVSMRWRKSGHFPFCMNNQQPMKLLLQMFINSGICRIELH